nr:subtilisin-like protease sbt4.3 [Quercus suber]
MKGLSINSFKLNGTSFPLIWGGDAANYSAAIGGTDILLANGVGTIMADSSFTDVAFSFPLPATVFSAEDGLKILNYIRSTEKPIATILVGETSKDVMAPYVVSFSSRGPNPIAPDILKPDLTAPGVDILAALSSVAPPSVDMDNTKVSNSR